MKTLFIALVVLVSLVGCEKESTIDNFDLLQGKWINYSDSSTIEIYKPVMYIFSDTLQVACDYMISNENFYFRIKAVNYNRKLTVITNDCIKLNNSVFNRIN